MEKAREKDKLWRQFCLTGDPTYYLAYREKKREERCDTKGIGAT